jgi:hypothetical protein
MLSLSVFMKSDPESRARAEAYHSGPSEAFVSIDYPAGGEDTADVFLTVEQSLDLADKLVTAAYRAKGMIAHDEAEALIPRPAEAAVT